MSPDAHVVTADIHSAERAKVVTEACSWSGTPYHTSGLVKGAGCDCATFILCVYQACGLIPETEQVAAYRQDWFCHTNTERYMLQVLRYAHKMAEAISYPSLKALPGSIALTKAVNSRVYNHGGIVVKWPRVLHSVYSGVEEVDASTHRLWALQTVTVFDPWEGKP